jgi:hypothetical protein
MTLDPALKFTMGRNPGLVALSEKTFAKSDIWLNITS